MALPPFFLRHKHLTERTPRMQLTEFPWREIRLDWIAHLGYELSVMAE
jgi:hypothetical protein